MTCDDAELTLALASMGEADAATLVEARTHARDCTACATVERDYAGVFELMARAAVPAAPPPALRRRVLDAVEAGARPLRGTPWWRRMWERVPSGRAFTLGGAVAVAALAALLVVESRGAPSLVTEPLQAGVNQPTVAGTLTYVRPTGDALVSVHGLAAAARTPSGAPAVYELWLMRGDGRVAAAGLLTQRPDGTWSAVVHRQSAAQVAVAATVEPAPGTQSPTGPQVFQVALPQM